MAPDYPCFGISDMPDPAMFAYSFDRVTQVVESFLKDRGFNHYGLMERTKDWSRRCERWDTGSCASDGPWATYGSTLSNSTERTYEE